MSAQKTVNRKCQDKSLHTHFAVVLSTALFYIDYCGYLTVQLVLMYMGENAVDLVMFLRDFYKKLNPDLVDCFVCSSSFFPGNALFHRQSHPVVFRTSLGLNDLAYYVVTLIDMEFIPLWRLAAGNFENAGSTHNTCAASINIFVL